MSQPSKQAALSTPQGSPGSRSGLNEFCAAPGARIHRSPWDGARLHAAGHCQSSTVHGPCDESAGRGGHMHGAMPASLPTPPPPLRSCADMESRSSMQSTLTSPQSFCMAILGLCL